MSGDRLAYAEAMQRGHSLAWEGDWAKAIQEYRRAVEEFPDDPAAQGGLGLAYLQTGRLAEALEAYRAVAQMRPDDTASRRRVAELYKELGRPREAAQAWAELAVSLERAGPAEEAEAAWRQAALLDPQWGTASPPSRAVPAPAESGSAPHRPPSAATAGLGEDRSLEALSQRALARLAERVSPEGEPPAEAQPKDLWHSLRGLADRLTRPSYPTGEAAGMGALAAGVRFHAAGKTSEAIRAYRKAVDEGLGGEEARFNLVVLEAQAGRCGDGLAYLEGLSAPEYLVAASLSLGECLQRAGKYEEALAQFWGALRSLDSSSAPLGSSAALQRTYDELLARFSPEERSRRVPLLAHFMGDPQLWQRVAAARQMMQGLLDGEFNFALAELIARPDGQDVLSSLDLAWQATLRERSFTALEELYRAIHRAPELLPLHVALAETLARQGWVEQAIDQLVMVASAFAARGDGLRALAAYRRAAALAGGEAATARGLLEFIISRKGERGALAEGTILADAYLQLGQGAEATEVARWGLGRASGEPWSRRYLEKLGELYHQLGEAQQAVRVYRDLKALDPGAEGPRSVLIELYHQLEWAEDARREWQELVALYRGRGESQRALSWLGAAVAAHPQDIPLRAALADAYWEAKRVAEAIQALDTLGELQLEAGQEQEAVNTIRRIVNLRPSNVDEYRRLLRQLGG